MIQAAADNDGSGDKRAATVTKAAKGEGTFVREAGGKSHDGRVLLLIAPNKRGMGIAIASEIPSGTLSAGSIQNIADGVQEQLNFGLGPYGPITDVIVRIVDGGSREENSNALALKIAGMLAVRDALIKADLTSIL